MSGGGLLVPPRSTEPEIMDGEAQTLDEIEGALRDIRLVNRYLGGSAGILSPLRRIVTEMRWRSFSLLDVGTGSADIPMAIERLARRRGWSVRLGGIDIHPLISRIADRIGGSVRIVRADARRLPFPAGSFDVVCASLFLHHFDDAEAAAILAELDRVARHAVLVNDLERHRVPHALVRLWATLLRASPMFRHDAPLSVLRGFTPEEMRAISSRAGLSSRCTVRRRHPYRLLLTLRKPPGEEDRCPGP